jgi:hypothetical protein
MSEKESLPPPVEPEWQGHYSHLSHVEHDPYRRASGDTRCNLDGNKTKPVPPYGSLAQPQNFNRQRFSQPLEKSLGELGQPRSRQESYSFGVTNTGSKLLDPVDRNSLGTEPFPHPRLTEAGSLYRPQGDGASGTELSQSDKDDRELSMSQDAEYDVEDEDLDENERDLQCHRQTVAERLAARRKMKRFRYCHDSKNKTSTNIRVSFVNEILTLGQAYAPADQILDERVCEAATSRRCPQRATVSRDSRVEPSTSPSLVPEQVPQTVLQE